MPESAKASESKRDADAEKQAERDRKRAEKQAEWDAADIEAFLAADRGERLLRGEDGSLIHAQHHDARQAEREREFDDED